MADKDPSITSTSSNGKDSKAASDDQTSAAPASTEQAAGARAQATEGATATPDPTQDAPNAERRTSSAKDKGAACPTCAGPLERYVGDNIHKLLTGFCHKCGVRHHVDAAT